MHVIQQHNHTNNTHNTTQHQPINGHDHKSVDVFHVLNRFMHRCKMGSDEGGEQEVLLRSEKRSEKCYKKEKIYQYSEANKIQSHITECIKILFIQIL